MCGRAIVRFARAPGTTCHTNRRSGTYPSERACPKAACTSGRRAASAAAGKRGLGCFQARQGALQDTRLLLRKAFFPQLSRFGFALGKMEVAFRLDGLRLCGTRHLRLHPGDAPRTITGAIAFDVRRRAVGAARPGRIVMVFCSYAILQRCYVGGSG